MTVEEMTHRVERRHIPFQKCAGKSSVKGMNEMKSERSTLKCHVKLRR